MVCVILPWTYMYSLYDYKKVVEDVRMIVPEHMVIAWKTYIFSYSYLYIVMICLRHNNYNNYKKIGQLWTRLEVDNKGVMI